MALNKTEQAERDLDKRNLANLKRQYERALESKVFYAYYAELLQDELRKKLQYTDEDFDKLKTKAREK